LSFSFGFVKVDHGRALWDAGKNLLAGKFADHIE
jgi:hypothetical protein